MAEAILSLSHPAVWLLAVDTVTGPFDIIVQLEGSDLDQLGDVLTTSVQDIPGVKRTTTCLAVRLG